MNRPLAENRGLGCPLSFVVVVLQRKQQWQIGIAVEGALVRAEIDWPEAANKAVVGVIELPSCFHHLLLVASVEL